MPTAIPWTNETWNPVTGCTKVSAGCANCYAQRMTLRLKTMGQEKYAAGFDKVVCHPCELEKPLRWKRPRKIFVDSMGDLFHKDVPDEFIDRVFAVMALCPQHTFQVLTKRPERGVEYLDDPICRSYRVFQSGEAVGVFPEEDGYFGRTTVYPLWPLLNVWLGTSVENQAAVNRIDHLVRCPAAVRFLNLEPLLGEVDLTHQGADGLPIYREAEIVTDRLMGFKGETPICWSEHKRPGKGFVRHDAKPHSYIDWVIVGGESGPGARPMKPDWVRSIRDQCEAAGVPFWFKGWGEWCYPEQMPADTYVEIDSRVNLAGYGQGDDPFRVGKKKAGDLLDGKHHHEWPKGVC